MTRPLYQCLLRMHPPAFRRRFAEEMLWIFDEAAPAQGAGLFFADGLTSLMRQWWLRAGTWKLAAAGVGGLLEMLLAAFLIGGPSPVRCAPPRIAHDGPDSAVERFSGSWRGTLRSGSFELILARDGATWMGQIHFQGPDGEMR